MLLIKPIGLSSQLDLEKCTVFASSKSVTSNSKLTFGNCRKLFSPSDSSNVSQNPTFGRYFLSRTTEPDQ